MPTKNKLAHYPAYVWNPTVHEKWAEERLHYFRLAFAPLYDRTRVLASLERYLAQQGVTSYEWDELYGPFDLILRLWLKPEHHADVFHYHLQGHLQDVTRHNCQIVDFFHVERIHYHWRWCKGHHPFETPEVELVPDLTLISEVDERNPKASRIEEALQSRLLSEYLGREGKIHFYMGMPNRSAKAFSSAKDYIPELVVDRFSKKIRDLAVYVGSGVFDVLVEGKIPFSEFEEISRLSNFLNESGVPYGVKCESYLVTGSSDRNFRVVERLTVKTPAPPDFPVLDVERYCKKPEGQDLEKKGSMWTNLDRWLFGDRKKVRDIDYAQKGPLKAIVGMLNASGGQLVIGLLEKRNRLPDGVKFQDISDHYVVGIEEEEGYKDWDKYHLALRDLIDKYIEPRIVGLLSIERVEDGARSVAIVTIQPGAPTEFFRVDRKVYVREGNHTVPIEGRELERYRKDRERRFLKNRV